MHASSAAKKLESSFISYLEKNHMENIIEKAVAKAIVLHAGQTRKGDGTPYINHPLMVGFTLARYSNDERIIAAGILHDTVEDCEYTLEELRSDFGTEIATLVSAVTEDKTIEDWTERKRENVARIKATPNAVHIKIADNLANMTSLLAAVQKEGTVVWSRFNASKEQKLDYFRAAFDIAGNSLPVEMVTRYVALLKDLEYSEVFEKSSLGFSAEANAKGK